MLEANSRLGRETFAFDPAGNIVDPPPADEPLRHPAGKLLDNLLKNYAGTSYRYDERGNMTERVRHGWRTVFAWDGFNRMTAATDQSGITTSFSYDALGRRLSKSSGETTTLFGWDGDVLAFESTQSKSAMEEGGEHGWSVHYIHEANSFVPLVQVRQARAMALSETTDAKALMEANGGVYDIEQDPLWNGEQRQVPRAFDRREMAFYQCDHLGTPQELTDHEGSIAWSAQYKAWGEAREAISEAGRRAGFRNPIRFQGQYWDEETGLHYNRYRYYDPVNGRFTSRDPIGIRGGLNVYAYAPSAISWVDPHGLSGFQPKKLTSGSVFRGASGTADSLTPRPGVDDMPKDSRLPGLSANVGIEGLGPGKYVEIDVARACSCGLDVIHDKADGHVTIRPQDDPSNEKLKKWAATRGAGASNSYTDGLLDSVRSRGKK